MVVKIAVAMLLGLAGLTVVGVESAFAAAGPPTVTGLAAGLNQTGICTAGQGFSGTADGGNEIAVCGTNFGVAGSTATTVTIGGIQAHLVEVASNSRLFVDVPPAANSTAAADVIVKNTALTSSTTSTCVSNPGCVYTYTWAAPTVTAVGLTQVTGAVQSGADVTITAAGTWTAGQVVSLGGFINNLTSGVYTIATGGNGSFTFPFSGILVSSAPGTGIVSPTPSGGVGSVTGGTNVVIGGTNLSGATQVFFGSVPATSYTSGSGSQITAIAPASTGGATGPVDITVSNPTPATSPATPLTDTYSYISTPTVTGVTTQADPAGGPTGGGTQVTITGTGFNAVTAVDFGSTPATSYLVNSLDSITAIAPAGTGNPDITVTAEFGTSTTSSADKYAYNGTLTMVPGTASYDLQAGTAVPATATSQTGSTVTVTAEGSWTAGNEIGISGFSNGLTSGTYTIATGSVGSFTIPFSGSSGSSGTGTVTQLNTSTPSDITATSQSGSTVTLDSVGTWYTGQVVYLSGFTNGIADNNYTLTGGGNGSFTITATTTGTGTGIAIPYQQQSFNAATLVTGGTSIGSVTVLDQPPSTGGLITVVGTQLLYTPKQPDPTFYTTGTGPTQTTTWLSTVTTTGTQTATIQICEAPPNASTCTTAVMSYIPGATGFYMGNQLSAAGQQDTVVEDTGAGTLISNSAPQPGATFTSTIAPPSTLLPSVNSGFVVSGIGGYHSITPIPSGITLVPGTLVATGGDTAATGAYTATLCTAAMGFVAGTCTANNATNFVTPYPYIETSLNVARLIAGGSQLSLPTITAEWMVGGSVTQGTQISSTQTEFAVTTVVQTIGDIILDAYPTDLASFLNTGLNAPVPTPTAPSPRWTVTVGSGTNPNVTGVSPNVGPTTGSTSVVITGNNFTGASAVDFGSTAAASFTVNSDTQITATTAPASAGVVDVTVTNGGVTSSTSPADEFTFQAPPTVTSVSPSSGPITGGTSVTITGTNFANLSGTSAVMFGTVDAASYTVNSATSITATSPAHGAATVDITVTTPAGTSATSSNDQFLYTSEPTISSISPTSGTQLGGTTVTINGSNLDAITVVDFGSTAAASFQLVSATQMTAVSPAESPGTVDITVGNGTQTSPTSAADEFTFLSAPTVTGVSPSAGPTAGGTTVVITGTAFTGATAVKFGTAAAASFTVNSVTQITAHTAAASAGQVDVRVTTPSGTSPTSGSDEYTFVAPPTVTSVSPAFGPTAGGTTVTITGTNLTGASAVNFGGVAAASFTVNSATQITAVTAAASLGTVDVTVTTAGGTSVTSSGDQYTFQPPPTISSIVPNVGGTLGGTSVVITGTQFANLSGGVAAVTFGGVDAEAYTVNSPTKITATTPANGAGAVDVVVTTAGGSVTDHNGFTYLPAPTVTLVAPDSGSALGGQSVVLTGTNLTGATNVTFGDSNALAFTVDSATQITATAPPGAAGAVDVDVTTPGGHGGDPSSFTYLAVPPAPPRVTSVTPGDGSVTVTWAPGLDGGTPILSYTATATPVNVPLALLVSGTQSCTVPAPATSCTITGLVNGTSYTFSVVATNSQGGSEPSAPSVAVTPSANGAIKGYWIATSTGGVFADGAALSYGNPAGLKLNAPIVALTPTPDRKGYWMVGSDGGVFSYGDAVFYGSTGGQHLNAPIVGMASTSDGKGYWLVAADGGVFAYGDAAFAGSTGGQQLNAPMVGIAGNGTRGYWLVAADGGVFAYGSAAFHGSAGAIKLVSPVVGITALPNGSGYYLAAADGGVFAYGAAFLGSASGVTNSPVVGITGGADGGYTLVTSNGDIYAYGAGYYGGLGSTPTTGPVIGISS